MSSLKQIKSKISKENKYFKGDSPKFERKVLFSLKVEARPDEIQYWIEGGIKRIRKQIIDEGPDVKRRGKGEKKGFELIHWEWIEEGQVGERCFLQPSFFKRDKYWEAAQYETDWQGLGPEGPEAQNFSLILNNFSFHIPLAQPLNSMS